VGTKELTVKQQAFLKHYLGADMGLHGNATQCYLTVYECTLKAAESGGARLLQNAKVQEYIRAHQQIVAEKTGIDAEYVLRQSIRLYNRAMGDEPIKVDVVTSSGEQKTIARRDYNPQVAKAALELIGRHTQIQAFSVKVEHSHTHRLEQRLAAKSKAVEKAALNRKLELVE